MYLPECASTNSHASDLTSKNNVAEGTVVITSRQFLGRGQRGNTWETEDGANLTFSIVLYPKFLSPANQFMLAKAVSLGIVDALTILGIPDARIKWPNDIMILDRKVCGILIENQVRGTDISQSVVGIGLNVNQVVFRSLKATSLSLVTGRRHDLNEVLAKVLLSVEGRYLQLRQDRATLSKRYLELLYWHSEQHLFETEGHSIAGTIEDVDESGRLVVSSAGQVTTFGAKEIAYIR